MANKERILKWAEALESGEYEQSNSYLRTNHNDNRHSYCCLGVACELSGLGGWQSYGGIPGNYVIMEGDQIKVTNGQKQVDNLYPPEDVMHWYGTHESDGGWEFNKLRSYAVMNDQGNTFAEIAEQIRIDFGLMADDAPDLATTTPEP